MHNTTWAPNIMLSSRKKLKSQFQENVQTEGWANLIYRTHLAAAEGSIRE